MIKAKGFIISGIVIALIFVFCVFFLNLLVKQALVAGGERALKAKVGIDTLKIDVFQSKITVRGLAVADRNKEFKNLFEAEEITADFELSKLLLRKLIVDKMEIINMAAGTDRKTSGFLPPAKLKKFEAEDKKTGGFFGKLGDKLGSKAKEEAVKIPAVKLADMAGKLSAADIKDSIKKEDLGAYKKIKEAEAGIKERRQKTEASIAAIKIDDRVNGIKASAASIKDIKVNGAQDIPAAKAKLEELNKLKAGLDAAGKSVAEARTSAEVFSGYTQGALKDVEKAKDQDVNNVLKKSGINLLNAGSLEKALIGPIWYDRVSKAMEIAALAKKYMPVAKKKGKKQKITERRRGAGRDIIFITDLPDFWIKEIAMSAKGGAISDRYIIQGIIKDLCTGQAAIGKPATFTIAMAKAGVKFGLKGSIDHINSINDSYTLFGKNMPPEMTGLSGMDYGSVKMKSALMDSEANVTSTDKELAIKGTAILNKMVFDTQDRQEISYRVLSGIGALKIVIEIKQGDSGQSILISSDALGGIKKSLNNIYGSKITEAKEKAKRGIENMLKGETKGLGKTASENTAAVKSRVKGMEDRLKSAENEIDRAKAEINKKISGAAGGGALKGLFGK